ncbi:Protein of unknown function [Roseateles sp. YR242]|uniref:DUF4254 domain-containing protein n=1 Tax=Roseateles sp. YR242 TaxID=1855305 RepID=UPI0008B01569|nr:DUF4254 domain-containing protein [Roseateles sp. YR242]SEL42658.1 Protein of unknown function [Roseateles sp. YR242]
MNISAPIPDPTVASIPLRAVEVVRRHDHCLTIAGWPETPFAEPEDSLLWSWVQRNHDFNARLWAEEDLARRTTVAAEDIAANKRAIDQFNQARNDAIERMDELMLLQLGLLHPVSGDPTQRLSAPGATVSTRLNSETAGSIIDRLSILALKIRAMGQQAVRSDVDENHRAHCRIRLQRLRWQREDLAGCLDALLADTKAGRACFKLYRQFKMYNDPQLNPALVAEQRSIGGGQGAGQADRHRDDGPQGLRP